MLWELLNSSCTPSCITCASCGGAGFHHCGAVPRWRRNLPECKCRIFPEPVVLDPETSLSSLDHNHEKERLPSIVVEPTDLSEVESGELRWPPDNMDMEEDEEDLFLEQCIPPANIADWGDEEEEEEETSVILNPQQGLTLIGTLKLTSAQILSTDLQSDAFRDDTPTLPPSSAPAFN